MKDSVGQVGICTARIRRAVAGEPWFTPVKRFDTTTMIALMAEVLKRSFTETRILGTRKHRQVSGSATGSCLPQLGPLYLPNRMIGVIHGLDSQPPMIFHLFQCSIGKGLQAETDLREAFQSDCS